MLSPSPRLCLQLAQLPRQRQASDPSQSRTCTPPVPVQRIAFGEVVPAQMKRACLALTPGEAYEKLSAPMKRAPRAQFQSPFVMRIRPRIARKRCACTEPGPALICRKKGSTPRARLEGWPLFPRVGVHPRRLQPIEAYGVLAVLRVARLPELLRRSSSKGRIQTRMMKSPQFRREAYCA